MRPVTLGAVILAGGTLLALPFRKSDPQPDGKPTVNQPSTDFLDDHSIDLLVREVTDGVEIPTVYQTQTDYLPDRSASTERHLPLTYEDLAVPVDRDPFYEQRFNATVSVCGRSQGGTPGQDPLAQQSPVAQPSPESQRLSDLERSFSQTRFVDQGLARLNTIDSPAGAVSPQQRPPTSQQPLQAGRTKTPPHADAKFASSPKRNPAAQASPGSEDHSVLSPLPAPDDPSDPRRPMHWIRQPD